MKARLLLVLLVSVLLSGCAGSIDVESLLLDVDPVRMSWDGLGESRPVADNGTDEGRQRNRRVDLVIQDAP